MSNIRTSEAANAPQAAEPMPTESTTSVDQPVGEMTRLVAEYLSENPRLADALEIFGVAEAEYRRSMMALTSTVITTGATTNIKP
jgi:hypothetical protein